MRRSKSIILVMVMAVFLVGCATKQGDKSSYESQTYSILLTAATTYDTTFQALRDLHEKGFLSDEDIGKAIKYGELFWTAYHSAVEALSIYNKIETAENKENIEKAMIAVTQAFAVFNEFIHPLLLKGVEK